MPRPASPGLHDPYWYEAVVGLRYVVDLLDDSSGVRSVTFQAPGIEGVDDVVVEYADARRLGIQVKHTRSATRLRFGDLVNGSDSASSLLRRLSRGWKALTADGLEASTELFTNRQIGGADESSSATSLAAFWLAISGAVQRAATMPDIIVPMEHAAAWTQWLRELDELTPDDQLTFLRTFRIDAGALDFEGQERAVIGRLTAIFGDIRSQTAEQVYDRLVRQLTVWTTSRRGTQIAVTKEQVLAAIGLPREEPVGEHDLAPPAPFFRDRETFAQQLGEALLADGSTPVVFLTGPAGCGKTSIVSAIANRLDPVIDLRFHAFRPISPETATLAPDYSRTATAVALWGDLLIQLRTRYFAGRLGEAGVPARNDLLNDEPARLRSHVLRLAALLATERGRPTVIAIDGLDHAARGRALAPEQLGGRQSLLDWLVPPSDVPGGVRFLIAGQPHADAYPSWLADSPGVRVEEVPLIATADIAMLLRDEPGQFPSDQIPRAAAIISELSRGNTLAAVYAAVEARTSADAAELQAKLESRQLQDGLEEYYNRIWQAAVTPMRSASPAVDVRLATALAISSARLTAGLLQGFFPDAAFSDLDWQRAFQALAPIIEEQGGSYAIRHNDVRIFLTRLLRRDAAAHASAASSIANYYRDAPASPAKHIDLVRALTFANRQTELPAVFTPSFVVDGWVVERSVAELVDQAHQAVAAVSSETGWDTLHTFALGLRTVQQLQNALQWLDEGGPPAPIPACLSSEARPVARSAWSLALIREVLHDAQQLIAAEQIPRARALLHRWFENATPVEVFEEVGRHPGELNPMEERDLAKDLGDLASVWGRLAQRVGFSRTFLHAPTDGDAGNTMAHFFGGWLRAGVTNERRSWAATLAVPRVWYPHDVARCVRDLAQAERWSDVATTLHQFTPTRDAFSEPFRIRAAAWALLTGNPTLVAAWSEPVAEAGFGLISSIQHEVSENFVELYDAVAFVIAWLRPTRPPSAISDEGTDAYFERRRYDGGHATLRRLLYAVAVVARLERAASADANDLGVTVRVDELAAVVRAFFADADDRGHEVTPYFFRRAPLLLARILKIVAAQHDPAYDAAIAPILRSQAAELPYDGFLDVLWAVSADCGQNDLLRRWTARWIGPDGAVWVMDLGDRRDGVRKFADLARGAGFGDLAAAAERRFRRSQIGYIGRKEYALDHPLQWFEAAAKDEPAVWEREGARLLSISQVASQGGDNRMAVYVEGAVTAAAARSGPAALWRCMMGLAAPYQPPLALGRTSAIDGIIAMLEGTALTAQDLEKVWAVANGCLVWQYDRHRLPLQHLREALLAVAASRNDTALPARLATLAPRAFEVTGNEQLYRYPARWYAGGDDEDPPPEHMRDALRLIRDLRQKPIQEAITELEAVSDSILAERMGSSSDLWRALADCAERLDTERPAGFRSFVERLIAITRARTEAYSWEFDGVERAFAALIPLMTEEDQWDLCRWIVEGLDKEQVREFWLHTAAHNLGALSGIRALAGSPADRRAGLDRELAAQETWIRGAVTDVAQAWPTIAWPLEETATPRSWEGVGVLGLMQIVGGARGAHRVQAALRGLYILCALDPSLTEQVAAAWQLLPPHRQYFVLLLAERLVAEERGAAAAFEPVIRRALAGSDAHQALQAAVVIITGARGTGDAHPDISFPCSGNHDHSVAPTSHGLLAVKPQMFGAIGLTQGPSAARQSILQLAAAFDLDADALEKEIADHLRTIATPPRDGRRRSQQNALEGEMLLTDSPTLEAVAAWAVNEYAAGCLGAGPPELLAQALLEMDDPWILTHPAMSASDATAWPVDDELDRLLTERARAIEVLSTHVSTGLHDGERVAGAVLHTFSRKTDAVLHVEARWGEDGDARGGNPTTFNGRTFVYYSDEAFEPAQRAGHGSLTLRAGGQGLIYHALVPPVPARIWRAFGWRSAPTNPLQWMDGDQPAARLEIFYGPIRASVQDRLYRQPVLARWVFTQAAWQRAEEHLGLSLQLAAGLECHVVPSS